MYRSLNGFSRLPRLYVNPIVGIISPEIVIVLPTYNVEARVVALETDRISFNVEDLLTINVEANVVALETDRISFKVEDLLTTNVEANVVALDTFNIDANFVEFLTYKLLFNEASPETSIIPFKERS